MVSNAAVYFKIQQHLKEDFDVICRNKKETLTMKLNEFVRQYVNDIKKNDNSLLIGGASYKDEQKKSWLFYRGIK
jgi:hypothetical protein